MPTIIFTFLFLLQQLAFSSSPPNWSFTCQTMQPEKEQNFSIAVQLWLPTNSHPMSGMSGVHGSMELSSKLPLNIQQKFAVEYWPNYSQFTLAGEYQLNSNIIEYKLISHSSVLEGSKQAASLMTRYKKSLFKKWIEYPSICYPL